MVFSISKHPGSNVVERRSLLHNFYIEISFYRALQLHDRSYPHNNKLETFLQPSLFKQFKINMFSSGVYYLFALASSVAAKLPEAAVPTPGPMGPGETCNPSGICWTGQIHSPCNGASMGCTPDNTKVSYSCIYARQQSSSRNSNPSRIFSRRRAKE